MESIPLLRARQLRPFVLLLDKVGGPSSTLLQKAKLPAEVLQHAESFVPLEQVWAFVDLAARSQGMGDFGLHAGAQVQLHAQGLEQRLRAAPTLYEALRTFCRIALEENTRAGFGLVRRGETTWFYRSGVERGTIGRRQLIQYCLVLMVEVVRVGAGPAWMPRRVCLETEALPALADAALLSEADVRLGCRQTALAVPDALLSMPMSAAEQASSSPGRSGLGAPIAEPPAREFVGSLRQALTPYLSEGCPEMQFAADIAGVQVRTLQRRLAKLGLSYSCIVDQARFLAAEALLREQPGIQLIEVAYELGYADPANFSRAFRRWAGITPGKYRKLLEDR